MKRFALLLLLLPHTALAAWPVPTYLRFHESSIFNANIIDAPVHALSAQWMSHLTGVNSNLWIGWYPGTYGMPYDLITDATPRVNISIAGQDPADSDVPGPYPFTASTGIENLPPDYHAFMFDQDHARLFEMYYANWNGGSPTARAAVIWDMTSDTLRADNHSSADEAGLPVGPLVTMYGEVLQGYIHHALRFELPVNHVTNTHIWPARHNFGGGSCSACAPAGARIRLKNSFNISGYSGPAQVVLVALKVYGMFLADIGTYDLDMVGTRDPAWPVALIDELGTVPVSAFEFVDESGMMVSPNSHRYQPLSGSGEGDPGDQRPK